MPSREDFVDPSESDPSNENDEQSHGIRTRNRKGHTDVHEDSPRFVSLMSGTASCVVIDSHPIYVEPLVESRPQDAPEVLERSGAVRKTRSAMLANLLASDATRDKDDEDARRDGSRPQGKKTVTASLRGMFSTRRHNSFSTTSQKDRDKPEEPSWPSDPSCRSKSLRGTEGVTATGSLSDPEDTPRRRTTFARLEHAGSMNRGVTYAKDSEESERTSFHLVAAGDDMHHLRERLRKVSDEDMMNLRNSAHVVTHGSSLGSSPSRGRHGTGSSELELHAYSEGSGFRSGHASTMDSSERSLSLSAGYKRSLPSMNCVSSVGTGGSGHTFASSPSESSLLSRRRHNKKIGALSVLAVPDETGSGHSPGSQGFAKLLAHRGLSAEKIIGRSANGGCKVMVANESEGSQVAIKCMCEARGEGVLHTILRREFELLRELHHPNIVKARSFLECEDQCGLVMELCSGVSLNKYMPSWSGGTHVESMMERCAVFEQVASAITYLHDKRIAHRDLHSENVLVSRSSEDRSAGVVKVLDFGSARRVDDASVDGTDAASGMMFLDDLERRILPPAVCSVETMLTSDVFALGLIAAGLVARKPLLTRHVCKGDPASPTLVLCSPPSEDQTFTPRAENYLKLLLHFNPDARITARVALETLPPAAEWFKLAATKMSL